MGSISWEREFYQLSFDIYFLCRKLIMVSNWKSKTYDSDVLSKTVREIGDFRIVVPVFICFKTRVRLA